MSIARDGGAAYPLVAGSVTNTATLQVNGVVTSAADTYIVVKVAWGQGAATVTQPVAVTWVGGAPAGCSNFECWAKAAYTVASPDATGVSIWLAKATQAIASSKSVLVTAAASALVAASMSVDAITGSDGPGEVVFAASNNGSSIARSSAVLDVSEGSWLFTAGAGDNPGGVTPQTNTTEEDERIETTNNAIAAVGTNSAGTKRSVDVGWTGSQAWFAVAALEMRASGIASVGPFSSARQPGQVWSGGFWAKNLIGSPGDRGVSYSALRSVASSYLFPVVGNDRTGTCTDLAGAGTLGAPTATRDGSGTVASLSGTGALAALVGAKSVSGTVADLTATGTLSTADGTRSVSGSASDLTGAGAYSTADGTAATSGDARSGTATALSGSGAYSSADGTRDAAGSCADLAGAGDYIAFDGFKAVSGTVADLTGAGTLGAATGTAFTGTDDRSGTCSDLRACVAIAGVAQDPWWDESWL